MRQHRGETLVVILNRHVGQQLAQTVNERFNAAHILGGCVVHLLWQPHNNALHRFALHIVEQKIDKRCGGNGCQPAGNNLQLVAHGQARTLLSIINSQYSCHIVFIFVSAFCGKRNHTVSQPQNRAEEASKRT